MTNTNTKNITRVRNCPDITILNSLSGFCLFVPLLKCLKGAKAQKSLSVSKF